MHRPDLWSTPLALKFYNGRALLHPNTWETRFNWESKADDGSDGFTQAEMDAIYAEVIGKIPAGVTRVLEIGCGDGRFGDALKTALPAVGYRGVDIVPDNIESARANYPTLDFVAGNAWEYLSAATVDWDFVVSLGCLFSCTEDHERMFTILDSKAGKGFVILADPNLVGDALLTEQMGLVSAASSGEVDSYVTGARAFLEDATLKGILRPFHIHRTGTTTQPASLETSLCVIETEKANEILERSQLRFATREGGPAPSEFKGFSVSGRLVTSIDAAKTVDPAKVARLPTRKAPRLPSPNET